MNGTGFALMYRGDPNHRGRGSRKMRNWFKSVKARLSTPSSVREEDVSWQETAAMVYVGDIYAVLLRDRLARRQAQSRDHGSNYRRDAGWPFIR